jgi:nitroreductase
MSHQTTLSPSSHLHRTALEGGLASSVVLTRHAARRAQQRSISSDLLDLLLDHGVRAPSKGGADIVHLTNAARRAVLGEVGQTVYGRHAGKLTTAYAVVAADGAVITVGHRFRRIGRRA